MYALVGGRRPTKQVAWTERSNGADHAAAVNNARQSLTQLALGLAPCRPRARRGCLEERTQLPDALTETSPQHYPARYDRVRECAAILSVR